MSQSDTSKLVHIVIYRITGKQLFFRIPKKVCEECDLSVATVHRVVEELCAQDNIKITVKPWINNLISCLFWWSWHPPVVTINGKRFSKGVVPNKVQLLNTLSSQLNEVSHE